MPADGGEAQQLTKMEKGVGGFDWAPDSQRIAISAEAPEPKAMKDRKESVRRLSRDSCGLRDDASVAGGSAEDG